MNADRTFQITTAILILGMVIFALIFAFLAKPLYALYADLFQAGQEYQGETRALIFNRFLLTFIAPSSLLLSTVLTWVLIKAKTYIKSKRT